jgi:hypothetical protein
MFLFRKEKRMDYLEYFKSLPSMVNYIDDHEYRNVIRKTFRFDPSEKFTYNGELYNFDELDEHSKDELLFDSKNLSEGLDELYKVTVKDYFFQELYKRAAARMFSESQNIGQVVLCSYDTFHWYYTCVWYYIHGGISSLSSISEYNHLKKYFDM